MKRFVDPTSLADTSLDNPNGVWLEFTNEIRDMYLNDELYTNIMNLRYRIEQGEGSIEYVEEALANTRTSRGYSFSTGDHMIFQLGVPYAKRIFDEAAAFARLDKALGRTFVPDEIPMIQKPQGCLAAGKWSPY